MDGTHRHRHSLYMHTGLYSYDVSHGHWVIPVTTVARHSYHIYSLCCSYSDRQQFIWPQPLTTHPRGQGFYMGMIESCTYHC